MQDFVELRRDFNSWSGPGETNERDGSVRHQQPAHNGVIIEYPETAEKEKGGENGVTIEHPPSHGHDREHHQRMYAAGDRHGGGNDATS